MVLQHHVVPCRERMPAILKSLRLEHGAVSVQGTPRRLVVMIEQLCPGQPDTSERLRGPPCKVLSYAEDPGYYQSMAMGE